MTKLLYLLWSHGEDGPEELVATLDKSHVATLAAAQDVNGWFARTNPNLIEHLRTLLETEGDKPAIHNLMPGWGGLHLQIVELSEPPA